MQNNNIQTIKFGPPWDEEYEAYCEGRLLDPYPLFAWLLEHHPIHWSKQMDGWFICRHEDAVKVLVDPRFSSNRASVNMRKLPVEMQTRFHALGEHISNWLGFMDEPRHTEIRRIMGRFLNAKEANKLMNRIELLSKELVNKMPPHADLVAEVAHALPLTIISEILGIPLEDRSRFRQTVINISDYAAEAGPTVVAAAERAHAGVKELTSYFEELLARRKAAPQNDIVTQLATSIAEEAKLSLPGILGLCVFFFAAGHDTTEMLIGSSSLLLLQHPEVITQLRDHPELIPAAVEEFLRLESPVTLLSRLATEDVELGGHRIRGGDSVLLCLSAANRDHQMFPDPNQIRLDRPSTNKHLAFGWAGHFCLGAPLARLEGKMAIGALLDRLAISRLEDPIPHWHQRQGLRALKDLWIRPA